MQVVIEPLAKTHNRETFACGEAALDSYIKQQAGQDQRRNVSRTYVAVQPGERHVLGFYTISSGAIAFQSIPEQVRRKLPRYPIPVVHLGRLAVDKSARGQGLGAILLFDALKQAHKVSDVLGVFAVEVRAKHERARSFYLKYGFQALSDDPFTLYLPLSVIRNLI